MPFSGPIRAQWSDDGDHMIILDEVIYTAPDGHKWVVPLGFKTDGASIPQEFWTLVGSPFTGLYRVAAVFHDAAYNNAGVSRQDADSMLRICMLELGCSQWLADVIYTGVRIGGELAYEGDQRSAAVPPFPPKDTDK